MKKTVNSFVTIVSLNTNGPTINIHRSRKKEIKVELVSSNSFGKYKPLPHALKIKSPDVLMHVILKIENDFECSFDRQILVFELAKLDWIFAAILSKALEVIMPPVPNYDIFNNQNSLRKIKGVEIAVSWYYEWHHIKISFEKWIRLVNGEVLTKSNRYGADGKLFTAYWTLGINNNPQIQIPTCWEGDFESANLLKGPLRDSYDLALLTLEAFDFWKSSSSSTEEEMLTVSFIPKIRLS